MRLSFSGFWALLCSLWAVPSTDLPPMIFVCTSAHLTANLPVYLLSMRLMQLVYLVLVNFLVFHSHFGRCYIAHCRFLTISFFVITCSSVNGSAVFYFLSAHFTATFVAFSVYLDTNLSLSTIASTQFGLNINLHSILGAIHSLNDLTWAFCPHLKRLAIFVCYGTTFRPTSFHVIYLCERTTCFSPLGE